MDSGCAAADAAGRRSNDEAAPYRHAAPELATAEAERAAESRAEDSMVRRRSERFMAYPSLWGLWGGLITFWTRRSSAKFKKCVRRSPFIYFPNPQPAKANRMLTIWYMKCI